MSTRVQHLVGTLAVIGAVWLAAPHSLGEVTAHFRVESISGGCFVDDMEGIFDGDPERYFRMAIFDDETATTLGACMVGCVDDGIPATPDGRTADLCAWNTGCGGWNFADLTLDKVIPDQSGAYFYFGLWDEDSDADDSLGDHQEFRSTPTGSTQVSNNNLANYRADDPIQAVCGRDVEGSGVPGNYFLTYSAWFTDDTAPTLPSDLEVIDDSIAGVD